jgi:hypothetical protein
MLLRLRAVPRRDFHLRQRRLQSPSLHHLVCNLVAQVDAFGIGRGANRFSDERTGSGGGEEIASSQGHA